MRICQKRAPKNARSSGVRSGIGPNTSRMSRNIVPASRGRDAESPPARRMWASSYCVNATPRRRHEVIRHLAPVERRYAAHGVDHVLVEAREEPEPMLAGQAVPDDSRRRSASWCPLVPSPSSIDGNAAGLAAGNIAALEDHDLEAALDQLVRGAHARDATAEHDDLSATRMPYAAPNDLNERDDRVGLLDAERDFLAHTEKEAGAW